MEEEFVKIPRSRIAVLIGKNGEIKKEIEKTLGVRLKIDSKSGDVEIREDSPVESLAVYKAAQVVRAIGRGFPPKKAFFLFDDKYYLNIVDITSYVSDKQLERVRARLIGRSGSFRKALETDTNTFIAIEGRTVSVIGEMEEVTKAEKAIEMIIKGARHNAAYRALKDSGDKLEI